MPKRMVDGEALWGSDKLAQVEPKNYRAEYANLIPLAEANGVFEADARKVWSRVYSFNRPDISPEIVEQILQEFERVGMIHFYEKDGKRWGYFNGIEKPGRLPAETHQARYVGLPPLPDNPGSVPENLGLVPSGLVRFGMDMVRSGSTENLSTFKNPKKAWKDIKRRFRQMTGRVHGGAWQADMEKWNDLVEKYGNEVVVYAAEAWIDGRREYLKSHPKAGLGLFLRNPQEWIDDAVDALTDDGKENQELLPVVSEPVANGVEHASGCPALTGGKCDCVATVHDDSL